VIDIKLVESFVLLMKSGSLTRAEDLSGISKATLSRQIARLEETLGVQLLHRTARRLAPTEAGRAFQVRAEVLLAEVSARLEAAHTELQDLSGGVSGDLSILADTQFSTSFVCHVVRRFLERFPDVRCRLDVAGRDASPAIDAVDCYVCAEPPAHPNLVGKLLGSLAYGLYASPHYLAAHGAPRSPEELPRHKTIVLDEARGAACACRLLHAQHAPFECRADSRVTANDYWVVKTFCIDGFGIALLPDFFTRPEVEAGVLRPVLPDWRPEPMRIWCAYQKQRYMGRKLRAFIDLMSESFQHIDSVGPYVGSRPAAKRLAAVR
jgi:DNA-binding transcriptional LysR family regulator